MKKVRRCTRPIRLATACVATAAVLAACSSSSGGSSSNESSSETFKIGVPLGLTGAYAAVGEPQQQALKLFEQRLEEQGGVDGKDVEFVYLDTGSNEAEAVNQLRRLVTQEQVVGIVGPSSSGEAQAMKPIVNQMKVPMVAIASSNAIVDPLEPYAFKEFPSSADALEAQFAYLQQKGMTSAALLSSNNAYGQEPADAAKSLADEYGIDLVANETFAPGATDLTPQLIQVGEAEPDVVLVWGIMPAPAIAAQNAKNIGYEPMLFMGTGAASAGYLENAAAVEGTLVEGARILAPDDVPADHPQHEVITDFTDRWREAYGSNPSQFAGGAWDAMLLMIKALDSGAVDGASIEDRREQLQGALEDLGKVPGTIAIYDFSQDVHGPKGIDGLATLTVEGGEFTLPTQ